MQTSGSPSQSARFRQRVVLALRHPDLAMHFFSNRLRALLLSSLMGNSSDPSRAIRLGEVIDRMKIPAAIETGWPICLDIGDQALILYSENIRRYGYEDQYAHQLFWKTLRTGHQVADLGAHNGYYTLLAARQIGAAGRIFAFEPDPTNYDSLVRNIRLNGYENVVTAEQKCVGDKSEMVTLTVVEEGSRSASLHMHPGMHVKKQYAVECVALDDYMPTATLDVVKMDVEGNELSALRGMQSVLARSQQIKVFAELHPTMLAGQGVTAEEYVSAFEKLGFHLSVIDEASHSLKPLSLAEVASHSKDMYWHTNLYAARGGEWQATT